MHNSLIEQHTGEARRCCKTGGGGDTVTSPGRGRSHSKHRAREGFTAGAALLPTTVAAQMSG